MAAKLRSLAAVIACVFAAGQAQSNGTGPTVVAGQASFSIQGSSLNITNSPGTIINWQGFSIDVGETAHFNQQSATSSVLNRVVGPDPSVILGTLSSNGRVFLINPSGILVGQGAHIDVAGLVASTLSLSDQDFLAGRLNFGADSLSGNVENQGSITTPSGGSVYLVGANVTNSGIINSPQGEVVLAAGQSVNIFDSSTPGVRVELTAGDNAAVNLGEILAQSGQVGIYGAALRNTGIINADQVGRDATGKIVLRAKQDVTLEAGSRLSANGEQAGAITVQSDAGTTLASGAIEAKSSAGKGGTVQLLGKRVGLISASIDASGTQGGGTVLVGGDYQGKNPSMLNASATYMSADSTINADALTEGSGGKVVLWADDSTRAYGSITARGGEQGGDGGLIETSGHWLDVAGIKVNASAPHGSNGTWLLDPADVTITSAVDNGGSFSGGDPDVFTPDSGASTANVNLTTITDTLNSGTDVTINTENSGTSGGGNGDISVDAVLTWSVTAPTSPSTLTLNAVRDVNVNSAITATRGSFVANAGRDVNISAVITTTDGDIVLRADNDGTGPGAAGGTVAFLASGSITMTRGSASIYYNPSSYATPTNYLGNFTLTDSTLSSYMWVFTQASNKIYDGLTTASLAFIGDPSAGGVNSISLLPGTADFDSRNVGTGKTVSYSGYSLGGADANQFSLFSSAGTTAANITQASLTLSTSNVTKTYDGSLTAVGAAVVSSGALFGGDTISGGSFAFTDKNVGIGNKIVTTAGVTVNDGNGGDNYSVDYANNNTSTINPYVVNLSGSRVYDGTLNMAAGALTTGVLVGTETLTLTGTGTVADKNVGVLKPLTLGTLALGDGLNGGLASNYTFTGGTQTAGITPLAITGSITADNKVYDGTVAATILDRSLTGALGTDVVSYSGGTATFSDKNAATGKVVTATGLGLVGTDAGNYTINSSAITTADITPAPLDITANNATRLYGEVNPAFSATYTGFQNGETAAVLTGALGIATPAVAASNVGNYTLTPFGQSSTNYTIGYVDGTLSVTPAPLMVIADAKSKLFGTPDPALTYGVTGLINNLALGITDIPESVLSGALTRVPGESALGGPYAITQGTLTANSNYTLSFRPSYLTIIGAAADPVLGFSAGQVLFAGVINNEFYYRPGNFWHISLNFNNADPGFDVMRGTNDLISRAYSCDSVFGGGFCETWEFPQQSGKGDEKDEK